MIFAREENVYGYVFKPRNNEFKRIIKSNYIDKIGLIGIINSKIESKNNLICVSRPRRFGKSYAAQMLCAYYDCTCDSSELFAKYNISENDSYSEFLNQFNVIYLDITSFISNVNSTGGDINGIVNDIQNAVVKEIDSCIEGVDLNDSFTNIILKYVETTQRNNKVRWKCVSKSSFEGLLW